MKIKEQYSSKMVQLNKGLNNLFSRMGMIDYNTKLLNDQKDKIFENIQKLNKEKNTLIDSISQQYGDGYVDPTTWQFHPKKKIKE